MNLRTLKKLCKVAAPLLVALGDDREQFTSRRYDNYHGVFVGDRKHWERGPCHPTFEGFDSWGHPRGADIVFKTRAGRHRVMRPPCHPRKGTIMVGSMVGYYEPEWEEECAWVALENAVYLRFLEPDSSSEYDGGQMVTRDLSSPALILAAARELVASERARA